MYILISWFAVILDIFVEIKKNVSLRFTYFTSKHTRSIFYSLLIDEYYMFLRTLLSANILKSE